MKIIQPFICPEIYAMKWKKLDNFSRYKISDTALVMNIRTKRFLKGCKSHGYVKIVLFSDNQEDEKHSFALHRVVATLFCPNTEQNPIVNHKDGNKLNNNADNLEWITVRENTQHASKMGLLKPTNQRKVRRISASGEMKEYSSLEEAFKENKDRIKYSSYICSVCSGTQKTAGGYRWEYIDPKERDAEPETGKTISGFTNYIIMSNGKIFSKSSDKFLNPSKNAAGYLVIDLYGDEYDDSKDHTQYTRKRASRRKKFKVHRLVAEYFLENNDSDSQKEVNHKNKKRADNRVENLEWVTSKQNLQHAHNKRISQYTLEGTLVREYVSITEASEITEINCKNISACLRKGEKATSGGFRWKYNT